MKKNISVKDVYIYFMMRRLTIKPKAYYSRALLLKLRVKTDDGHRVAGSGLDHSVQIISLIRR